MAFKCGPATWKSWLNPATQPAPADPNNDGFIDTDVVFNTAGDFLGFHRLQSAVRPILGRCADMPDDRISIVRIDGPNDFHLYFGKITVLNGRDWVEKGNGIHRRSNTLLNPLTESDWDFTRVRQDDKDAQLTDDEWVAVKTT